MLILERYKECVIKKSTSAAWKCQNKARRYRTTIMWRETDVMILAGRFAEEFHKYLVYSDKRG